jgi:hypothetical protein
VNFVAAVGAQWLSFNFNGRIKQVNGFKVVCSWLYEFSYYLLLHSGFVSILGTELKVSKCFSTFWLKK